MLVIHLLEVVPVEGDQVDPVVDDWVVLVEGDQEDIGVVVVVESMTPMNVPLQRFHHEKGQ